MSFSQAIRGSFLFFKGSAVGGTMPTDAIFLTSDGDECSSMIFCAGLRNKTIEIRGLAADFGGHNVVVEGTISEGANDKAFWFPLTGAIVQVGLVTIVTNGTGPQQLFHEPELTWLRIRATHGELGKGTLPKSIGATLAGIYDGQCWDRRIKSAALGYPSPNRDYSAV